MQGLGCFACQDLPLDGNRGCSHTDDTLRWPLGFPYEIRVCVFSHCWEEMTYLTWTAHVLPGHHQREIKTHPGILFNMRGIQGCLRCAIRSCPELFRGPSCSPDRLLPPGLKSF